jgi:hypothetical protein
VLLLKYLLLLYAACVQAKDQAELNELLIWAAARGLLADVSWHLLQAEHRLYMSCMQQQHF